METSVWDVLFDVHGEDIDSLITCFTDYIYFCVDNTVSTSTVQCFSNNKLWITPEIKTRKGWHSNQETERNRKGCKDESKMQ